MRDTPPHLSELPLLHLPTQHGRPPLLLQAQRLGQWRVLRPLLLEPLGRLLLLPQLPLLPLPPPRLPLKLPLQEKVFRSSRPGCTAPRPPCLRSAQLLLPLEQPVAGHVAAGLQRQVAVAVGAQQEAGPGLAGQATRRA